MSHHTSFWQRLGSMFRGGFSTGHGNGNGATEPQPSVTTEGGDVEPAGLVAHIARREPAAHPGRVGVQRVVEMMDALEEHFSRQDERAQQLGQHVAQMVGILEQLAGTGHEQQEHVRSIAEHVREAGRHAASVSESLRQVPELLRNEAEVVRAVARQMEVSQESDTQLMHSLQKLTQAVDALHAAGTAQAAALGRLQTDEQEQKTALTLLVREQGRRFLWIIVIAAVFGVGIVAALTAVLMWQMGIWR